MIARFMKGHSREATGEAERKENEGEEGICNQTQVKFKILKAVFKTNQAPLI